MSAKTMKYDTDARSQIARGLDMLANTVKVTLGPRGRNVVIEKGYGSPTITKDGVTVAKEIELDNSHRPSTRRAQSWLPRVPTRWSSSAASTLR